MPADYAGALAAIRERFIDNWKINGALITPIGFVNDADPTLVDENGGARETPWQDAWVLFEIVHSGSRLESVGAPGANAVVYFGLIKAYVFARAGKGSGDATAKALTIGEIFRNQVFYDAVTPGCFVRTGYRGDELPRIEDGEARSEDGAWFSVTATIPFDYWHRA